MDFWHVFTSSNYFIDPFNSLFSQGFTNEGISPPVTGYAILKEDGFALLKEDGEELLLE